MIGSFLDLDLTTPAVYIEAIRKTLKQSTDKGGRIDSIKMDEAFKAINESLVLRKAQTEIRGHAVETLLFMEGRKLLGVLFTGNKKAEAAFLATYLNETT